MTGDTTQLALQDVMRAPSRKGLKNSPKPRFRPNRQTTLMHGDVLGVTIEA